MPGVETVESLLQKQSEFFTSFNKQVLPVAAFGWIRFHQEMDIIPPESLSFPKDPLKQFFQIVFHNAEVWKSICLDLVA